MIEDALAHELVVTVEDGIVEGGVGSLIDAVLRRAAAARAHRPDDGQLRRPDRLPPTRPGERHPRRLGLDGQGISRTVLEHL